MANCSTHEQSILAFQLVFALPIFSHYSEGGAITTAVCAEDVFGGPCILARRAAFSIAFLNDLQDR